MGVESVELLRRVHLLREDDDFLLHPLLIELRPQFAQFFPNAFPARIHNLRHALAHTRHDRAHVVETADQQGMDFLTLPAASLHQTIHRLVEKLEYSAADQVGVQGTRDEHAGPAHHVHGVDRGRVVEELVDFAAGLGQLPGKVGVHGERGRFADGALEAQVALNLAPLHSHTGSLAHLGFEEAQFVRQPYKHFQVAMVDGAQLPGRAAPVLLRLTPSEGGHAACHG